MSDQGYRRPYGSETDTAKIPATGVSAATWPTDDDLPRLSSADQSTIDALAPGTALLIVLRGPNTGARFLLDTDAVSVGRHPSSDIFLDDVTVSRKHAMFERSGQGYSVRDTGSLNGTYLNRNLVDQTELQAGDEVQVGKFRLVYYPSSRSAQ